MGEYRLKNLGQIRMKIHTQVSSRHHEALPADLLGHLFGPLSKLSYLLPVNHQLPQQPKPADRAIKVAKLRKYLQTLIKNFSVTFGRASFLQFEKILGLGLNLYRLK